MIGYQQCDVAFIVPLSEEFVQLQQGKHCGQQYRINDRTYTSVLGSSLNVWATCVGEMGNAPALQCTRDVIDALNPRIVICTGIGGSLHSGDLQLGDVAVSRWIKDIADAGKVEDTPDTYAIKTVARPFPSDESIIGIIENLPRAELQVWRDQCAASMATLAPASEVKRDSGWPRVQIRGFASGFVIASDRFRLTSSDRELAVAETEGAGVGRAARNRVPFVVIRGISDYADPHKRELETETKNIWRSIAAANALSFALFIINLPAVRTRVLQLAGGQGFVAWPVSKIRRNEARSLVKGILDRKKAPSDKLYLIPHLEQISQTLTSLEADGTVEEDSEVVELLLDLCSHSLHRSNESLEIRLAVAKDIVTRIRQFRTGRELSFDELPIAAEVYHQMASLAHREGDLVQAVRYQQRSVYLDEKFGRTVDALAHKRCLYCMQAELLSPLTRDLSRAYIGAIDKIDRDMASATLTDSNGLHHQLAMRIVNALVQAKAAIFADALTELSSSLQKASQLLEELREWDEQHGASRTRREEFHAMWTCYRAVQQWAEDRRTEAVSTIKETKDWAKRTQHHDYCFFHLPDSYDELLGSLKERLQLRETRQPQR